MGRTRCHSLSVATPLTALPALSGAPHAPQPARIVAGLGFGLMRAVLIVNPTATSTTTAGRDLLAHALKSRLELTVEHTRHRGHGAKSRRPRSRTGSTLSSCTAATAR